MIFFKFFSLDILIFSKISFSNPALRHNDRSTAMEIFNFKVCQRYELGIIGQAG